jgi:predicted lipoprotein
MKWLALLPLLVLLTLGIGSVERQTNAQTDSFDRRAMLENIGNNIILPLHEAFLEQVTALQAAAHAFRDAPSEDNLLVMQQPWRDTSFLWEKVNMFKLGRLTFVYHSRIENDSPIAIQIINDIINGTDPFDESSISVFGSNVIGLRTVEYLTFDPAEGNARVLANFTTEASASRRMLYLMITVDDLFASAEQIWQIWSPEYQNYVADFIDADDASSVQESIVMLTNQMLITLESVTNISIGWPVGTVAGTIQPDLVQARYSGYSIEQIRSFYEILRATFNGDSDVGAGLGYDDYLNAVGAMYNDVPLADAINTEIDHIFATLDTMNDAPLRDLIINDTPRVQTLYDESRDLVIVMKVDMTSQLGVTITFSDADGD